MQCARWAFESCAVGVDDVVLPLAAADSCLLTLNEFAVSSQSVGPIARVTSNDRFVAQFDVAPLRLAVQRNARRVVSAKLRIYNEPYVLFGITVASGNNATVVALSRVDACANALAAPASEVVVVATTLAWNKFTDIDVTSTLRAALADNESRYTVRISGPFLVVRCSDDCDFIYI